MSINLQNSQFPDSAPQACGNYLKRMGNDLSATTTKTERVRALELLNKEASKKFLEKAKKLKIKTNFRDSTARIALPKLVGIPKLSSMHPTRKKRHLF